MSEKYPMLNSMTDIGLIVLYRDKFTQLDTEFKAEVYAEIKRRDLANLERQAKESPADPQ